MTQSFDSDDVIVSAVWARAERLYRAHGPALGYHGAWGSLGLTRRFRFFEVAAQAMRVTA